MTLGNILELHHAVGEFVGARLALREADGTITEVSTQAFLPAEDLSQFGIDHGYGLGIERYVIDDMTVLGHLGTGQTGSSYLGYDPERGTAVAVTTNTAIAGPSGIMAIEALRAMNQTG